MEIPDIGTGDISIRSVGLNRIDIPNIYVDYCRSDLAVPVGYWRSVGPSQNTFITESFIDEIAQSRRS